MQYGSKLYTRHVPKKHYIINHYINDIWCSQSTPMMLNSQGSLCPSIQMLDMPMTDHICLALKNCLFLLSRFCGCGIKVEWFWTLLWKSDKTFLIFLWLTVKHCTLLWKRDLRSWLTATSSAHFNLQNC